MMRRLLLVVALAGVGSTALADQSVNGYYRKDGTYVAPHHRSNPNSNKYDNYNAKGNANPYTGKQGSEPHEYSDPYSPPKAYRPKK